MLRRVDAKAYERLAKEEQDFAKDAELLRAAIRGESPSFQNTIEARIKQVLVAAHQVVLAGQNHADAELRRALDELAEAIRLLNADFPEGLRSSI